MNHARHTYHRFRCADSGTPAFSTRNAGMTLIEVMIACSIMGISLVMLMGSLMSISSTGKVSEERTIADTHVSSILEEISPRDLDTLLAYQPPGFRGLRSEEVRVACVDTSGNEVVLPVDPDAPAPTFGNPVEVRVQVSWQDSTNHTQRRTMSTFHRY